MRVLFDTNVVLDLVLDREPDATNAAALFSMVEEKQISGFLCATTITTIHYLAHKTIGLQKAKKVTKQLLELFGITPVNDIIIINAYNSDWKDFEDAILHQSAITCGMDSIVTRNTKDYKKSEISVHLPIDMLSILSSTQNA